MDNCRMPLLEWQQDLVVNNGPFSCIARDLGLMRWYHTRPERPRMSGHYEVQNEIMIGTWQHRLPNY